MFHWYGFVIGLAIVVGYSVAEKIEPKVNKVVAWILIGGIIGARIYHVVSMWGYYAQNGWQIMAVWQGGLSIWGGLIGGGLGFLIGERRKEKGESGKMLAAIVTALPLAQAIGRIGNAVNGEFVNQVWVLPWWGAEALLDLCLFGVILIVPLKWRAITYLGGYGLIRLVLAPYRL